MALKWQRRIISIRCDSVSVCKWVESVIFGDKRIRMKGISEALVRRRLWLIQQTILDYELSMDITLIPSARNVADALTRVPELWLRRCRGMESVAAVGIEAIPTITKQVVCQSHACAQFLAENQVTL